jgi:hypothetical protein
MMKKRENSCQGKMFDMLRSQTSITDLGRKITDLGRKITDLGRKITDLALRYR